MGRLARAAAVVALAALAAPAATAAPAPRVYTIEARNLGFGPAPAGLKVGDMIQWVNVDIFQHSATARDGSFDVELPPKARVRTVMKKAGQIAFFCRYHPGMTGTLKVAR